MENAAVQWKYHQSEYEQVNYSNWIWNTEETLNNLKWTTTGGDWYDKIKVETIEYVIKKGELVTAKISDYDEIAFYKDFNEMGKIVTRKIIDTEEFTYIEELGIVTEDGELNMEKLIRMLLQERYFRYL